MDIQTAIIEAKKANGWSNPRLAEAADVSVAAVATWTQRRRIPSAEKLLVLFRVLPGFAERLGVQVVR